MEALFKGVFAKYLGGFLLKIKLSILLLILVSPLFSVRQAYGMASARFIPKVLVGALASIPVIEAVRSIKLLQFYRKKHKEFVFAQKEDKKYLAPESIQKMAREIYGEICANNRKWYDVRGQINDLLVKQHGLNVHQGNDSPMVQKNLEDARAVSATCGIYFPAKSFVQNTPVNPRQRWTLHHELIHQYRGDTYRAYKLKNSNFFGRFLYNLIKKYEPDEFKTEEQTIISLHKKKDHEALFDVIDNTTVWLGREKHIWNSYIFGRLSGFAKLYKKDPELRKRMNNYLDKQCADGGHPKNCSCKICSAVQMVKTWKRKGFLRSKLWNRNFCKQYRKNNHETP